MAWISPPCSPKPSPCSQPSSSRPSNHHSSRFRVPGSGFETRNSELGTRNSELAPYWWLVYHRGHTAIEQEEAAMSESALAKKMKLKPGQRATVVNPPEGYLAELSPLPD